MPKHWGLITFVYVLLIVFGSIFAWVVIWKLSEYATIAWSASLSTNELLQREHDLQLAAVQTLTGVAQLFGGAAIIIGLAFTWKNLQITENNVNSTQALALESQITERFGRAVDQLGNERLEIRLGGIYALERIARDSERDHWPIMEVLTAFIRERTGHNSAVSRTGPISDIQAAVTVIGRRIVSPNRERGCLDLHGADLSHMNLESLNLARSLLVNAKFNRAYLKNTDFSGASLRNADFSAAFVDGANFTDADLTSAQNLSTPTSGKSR